MAGIWVYAEHHDGKLKKVTFELLGKGRELAQGRGEELGAILLGKDLDPLAEELSPYADRVHCLESPMLEVYNCDAFLEALSSFSAERNPSMIMAGATYQARDLFPALAGRLQKGIVVDCLGVELADGGRFLLRKPIYGGKALVEVAFKEEPQLVLVRPRTFPPAEPRSERAEVSKEQVEIDPTKVRLKVLEVMKTTGEKVDITEADVIVCGGRGLKDPENFKLLEELAEVVGGVVGATRAVVDAGWRPQEDQVGKSGKTVSPNLYFAVGLSGAVHHVMGMDTSKVVVAINRDPMAPIFQYADYGLVADLFQVVPLLAEELKKELGK